MLAFQLTFLVAAYLLGPDLISRWLQSFVVPPRSLVQTKAEEITRAVIWAALPLVIAILWAHKTIVACGGRGTVETFFSASYDADFFEKHQGQFFHAAKLFALMNWSLLWRLYAVVICVALLFNYVIAHFSRIRHRKIFRTSPKARAMLASLVIPRISEWHVLLTGMLSEQGKVEVKADVMTKIGILYRGRVAQYILGHHGDLSSLILEEAVRFRRDEFIDHGNRGLKPKKEDYWANIPGRSFTILASDISTINLQHSSPMNEEMQALVESLLTEAGIKLSPGTSGVSIKV
jgi:hypothetical protein